MSKDIQDDLDEQYRNAFNAGLRILAGRDHSKYELSRKLATRGYSAGTIAKVVSECERFGYLDDLRTAGVFIRQLHRKGYGLKLIRSKLAAKGLHGNDVQNILAKSISETNESLCAAKLLEKHAPRFNREKDLYRRKQKIYRFLHARGFSNTVIAKILADSD